MTKMISLFVISGILLLVTPTVYASAPADFGRIIGHINGLDIRSNGRTSYISNESNYVNGKYMGMKWQCVELARRYTYLKKGYLIPHISGKTGTAKDVWNNASSLGLSKAVNGGTNRPRTGDLVFSTYRPTGHVGVIASAPSSISKPGTYTVTIAHQNWSATNPLLTRKLTVSKVNGVFRYSLEGYSPSYTIKGWAWR